MTTHYSERQRFRGDWLWALLIAATGPGGLLAVVAIAAEGAGSIRGLVLWSGVVLVLAFGPLVVFYHASLSVEDVDALGDFGGIGVRLNPTVYRWGVRFDGPVGYLPEGDRGVRVERREGRDLVVTSTDPSALAGALRRVCGSAD